ncbi:MAG: menaquinone biosynthesis protein [Flavobacteriales bacterium]|nr:menaquinone biosynthesis protein [Flavobacteriales bacterium]
MEQTTDKIKVSVVSYANSYPFIFGLKNHAVIDLIDLQLDTPAHCAKKLLSGEVELGLVPVAIIPDLKEAHIISDCCIGADGAVETVCLFSEVPLEEIEEVLLDYQSRTSVQLVQLLAQKHWKITPKWKQADADFIENIKGKTAGVVIGDRAFPLHEKFPVVKDLAQEWKDLTGLPFVFACWVSNKPLSAEFVSEFQEALNFGLNHKQEAIASLANDNNETLVRYVEKVISYKLDDKKLQALKLFHEWLSKSS